MKIDLESAPFELNLAEKLKDQELEAIGIELKEQIELDESSRKEWMDNNKNWLRLASQVRETKNTPWPGASNVKYPLLTVASMQFHARALPNLVNSSRPVQVRKIGRDKDQQKLERANRIETYMSYQILEGMDDWLDEMDRMLFVLPMLGICYKKTYFSEAINKIKSCLVLPNDLIVNYHARSFDRARMTHVLYMDTNEVYELQADGLFLDCDLDEMPESVDLNRHSMDDINAIKKPSESDMAVHEIYESHCYLDLDKDGYKEPYIVTMTKEGKILRISARWNEQDVYYNEAGKVRKIKAEEYFTPYIFMPDPSSAVSGLGLGALLGPTNEAVNTIINQLIDAGTLSNQQSGFLGRGIQLRGGATRFRPGEWKIVNSTGQDLRNNIFPMPIREPSMVLFQLLGSLIESGERISAVSDMMIGESPGQNQPATTTMAVLEQGLKVFTSIHKRIHRQLGKEYKRIYGLNHMYLDVEEYNIVLDESDNEGQGFYDTSDFESDRVDVIPASDPAMVSQAQKAVKSQALMEKLMAGLPLNVQEITKRVLEAEEHENVKELMNVQPRPNPEAQLEMMKFQHEREKDMIMAEIEAYAARSKILKEESEANLNVVKAQQIGAEAQLKGRQQAVSEIETQASIVTERIKAMSQSQKQQGTDQQQ